MYNPQLKTFIRVADAGSFNKAAEAYHITPTALIKQINSLESKLGLKLFNRTHRGLALTKAGESLYRDSKYIIEYSHKAVIRAKKAMQDESGIIRIGTSPMTPVQILKDLWPQVQQKCPDLTFSLVPFENTPENASEILRNLGEHIDIVAGVFDETLLDLRECAGMELSKEPIHCALSINHPLSQKDGLLPEDLYKEEIMIIRRGWSKSMDLVRDDLLKACPSINVVDFGFYDLDVFNQCEQERKIMLVIPKWENLHPMMKVIPVNWGHTISYGILYSKTPSQLVRRFLKAIEESLGSN